MLQYMRGVAGCERGGESGERRQRSLQTSERASADAWSSDDRH